jgi:hypothetical protein
MRRLRYRGPVALVCAASIALVAAGAALADKEKVHLTSSGQAAAHAAVLKKADLGSATGWTGGSKKPEINSGTGCKSFQPKQSDLVLIGAAETVWKHAGIEFDSQAQVLQTPEMVRLDWKRTVLAPQVMPCLKSNVVKSLTASERLVSFKRLAFPKVATYTRAYRAVMDVKSGSSTVRVFTDILAIGRGNVELTIGTTALYAGEASVKAAEVRLAKLLVSRTVV